MPQHTLKRFDEELERLSATISEMGGLAENQVALSLVALRERDSAIAEKVRALKTSTDALSPAAGSRTASVTLPTRLIVPVSIAFRKASAASRHWPFCRAISARTASESEPAHAGLGRPVEHATAATSMPVAQPSPPSACRAPGRSSSFSAVYWATLPLPETRQTLPSRVSSRVFSISWAK